ncbi:hypothetical protein WDU94_010396 [Cyamophila willieti]
MHFFNIFVPTRNSETQFESQSSKYAQAQGYEEDYSESVDNSASLQPWWLQFFPRDHFKPNIASVLFAALSHYLYGIFFNAFEAVNSRYDYPNFGSMCFVLATALVLIRFDLSLKSLPIESRTWKHSVYKVLAVIFLTHLVLAGIWQQIVNLTWELFFLGKDGVNILNAQMEWRILSEISRLMTLKTAKFVTHMEGLAILVMVIYSSAE